MQEIFLAFSYFLSDQVLEVLILFFCAMLTASLVYLTIK